MKRHRLPLRSFVVLAWMALAGAIHHCLADPPSPNETAIRTHLRATFEKPDAPLTVEPVVIGTSYAVAGWRQGDRGGRVLLRLRDGRWAAILCSGDPLHHADGLVAAGVPAAEAGVLADALDKAEQALTRHQRDLLSTFIGTVDMTAHTHHP